MKNIYIKNYDPRNETFLLIHHIAWMCLVYILQYCKTAKMKRKKNTS